MVKALRDVEPIWKVVPIHCAKVDRNRRIPLLMKSMDHTEDVLEPAAFLGSYTEVDVQQGRVGESVDEGQNAGENGHHMIGREYTLTRPFHLSNSSIVTIHATTTRCVVFNKSIRVGRTR